MKIQKTTISKYQLLALPFIFFFVAQGIYNSLTHRVTYSLSETIQYFLIRLFLFIVLPLVILGSSSYLRSKTEITVHESTILSILKTRNFQFCLAKIDLEDVASVWYRKFSRSEKSKPILTIQFLFKDNSKVTLRNIEESEQLMGILKAGEYEISELKGFFGAESRIPKFDYSEIQERKKLSRLRIAESRVEFGYSHDRGGQVSRFAQALATLMVMYLFATGSLFSNSDTKVIDRYRQLNEAITSEDRLDLGIQVTDIDPVTKLAQVQLIPNPSGNIGMTTQNGWVPNDEIAMSIGSTRRTSELQQSNTLYFAAEQQSNISATADATYQNPFGACEEWGKDENTGKNVCVTRALVNSSIKNYPFDKYFFSLPVFDVSARSGGAGTDTYADDTYESVPLRVYDYTSELNTWKVSTYPISTNYKNEFDDVTSVMSDMKQGNIEFLIEAKRDRYTILLVFIVCLLMVASMMSVILMGISVSLKYRPPTVQALVWAAALTFSLIQLRTLMPGSPPVGTTLDVIFYFPALLMTIGGSIWILWHWMRRADYGI